MSTLIKTNTKDGKSSMTTQAESIPDRTPTDGRDDATTIDDRTTMTITDVLRPTTSTDGQEIVETTAACLEVVLDVEEHSLAASSPLPPRVTRRSMAIVSDSQSDAGSSVPGTPIAARKRLIDQETKVRLRKNKTKSRKIKHDVETDLTGVESSRMEIDADKTTTTSSQPQETAISKDTQEARPLSPKSSAILSRQTEADARDLSYEESCIGSLGGVSDANLENLSVEALGNRVMELTKEIETMRQKCHNIQGKISGHMKKNLRTIQEGVFVLVGKALATGDPAILKMQNKELIVRNRELERENGRLKDRLRQSQGGADSPIRKRKVEKALSPRAVYMQETQTEEEGGVTDRGGALYQAQAAPAAPLPMPQRRPRTLRAPIAVEDPDRSDQDVLPDVEKVISRQIDELVALRRLEREKKKKGREKSGPLSRRDDKTYVREAPERRGPRIVENIQLVPPRTVPVTDYSTAGPSADEGWQIAKGGRQRQKRR